VLEVRYVGREYPRALLLFEVPKGRTYWRVYSMDGPPNDRAEARAMLTSAQKHFHRPFWYQLGNELILSYPTPNDGETLLIIYAQETPSETASE